MTFFLFFLVKTICYDPSSELSHRDGSDEGSQHVFYAQIKILSLIITKYSFLSGTLNKGSICFSNIFLSAGAWHTLTLVFCLVDPFSLSVDAT